MSTLKLFSKLQPILGKSYVNNALAKYSTTPPASFDVDYLRKLRGSSSEVILDKSRPDNITVIALNRQSNKNALSANFVKELKSAFKELKDDKDSRAVVLCSLVKSVFCAGADLKERAQVPDSEVPALVGGLRYTFQLLHEAPMPIIAALDGHALGGGLELALACDLRYATDRLGVKIGLVESHWALLPGAGGSQRLPRLIGVPNALELMFRAKIINGPQAYQYGIVNGIANHSDCTIPEMAATLKSLSVAKEISTKGPIAIRMIKKAVNHGITQPLLEGLELEGSCYEVLVPTNDRKEGMKAFAEKRTPVYKNE